MLQFKSRCHTFSVCLSRFFCQWTWYLLRLISQQLIFNLEISFSEPKTAESIAHCGELLPRRVSSDFYYFFLFSFTFFYASSNTGNRSNSIWFFNPNVLEKHIEFWSSEMNFWLLIKINYQKQPRTVFRQLFSD